MRAVGYSKSLPIDDVKSLQEITLPDPQPGTRDLLVEVKAVSMNPVDTKVRKRAEPKEGYRILGFDASGIVRATGSEVTLFQPGDEVFYAGDLNRPGTNAELHVVDERIVGKKPSSLSFADAAALPLTAITAWELLFDSFGLAEKGGQGDSLLVIGGAGGVGSMLTQLAKQLTGLKVIVTASREETKKWCLQMGADGVIDHRQPLGPQLEKMGIVPRYVASLTATDQHFKAITEILKPRGAIAMIDDPDPSAINVMDLKPKSLSLHLELMFTRSIFETEDMIAQHELLNRVSALVDENRLRTTCNHHGGVINAENLRQAHRQQESGRSIGKTVLEGF
ncbi:MAG: zinc-binding alcohol dehydrogenase family protein [Magnetococcales bacterium]|nr:zinc-binding alcohol dehydrogenase family protein [Magnetococcales bacterium]